MTKFENFHWKRIIVMTPLSASDLSFLQSCFPGCFIWMLVSQPSIGFPTIYDTPYSKSDVLVSCFKVKHVDCSPVLLHWQDDITNLDNKFFMQTVRLVSSFPNDHRKIIFQHDIAFLQWRWNNVLLPKRARYFHLKRKVLIDEQEDEYAVPVNNVVQIFDWDHAFFWAMPEHDRGRISETYHASYETNMNDIYDKLAFLRLLHRYFPCKFMDESDVDTMQPAFYDYVYRDPDSGKALSQISQKGIGEPTWPGISDMRRAINEALHKVYVTASRTIVAHRVYLNRQKLLLAVEGDNPEGMKAMLRKPFVLDLGKNALYLIHL